MKKLILISSLLAAGTMMTNAATLLGEWDFSTATLDGTTIAATSGDLSMTIGGTYQTLNTTTGTLNFTSGASSADSGNYAVIDIAGCGIGPASGNNDKSFTIVITLTSWTLPTASGTTHMLWSTAVDPENNSSTASTKNFNRYTTGLAITPTQLGTMWSGSSGSRVQTDISSSSPTVSEENPLTIRAYYSSSGAQVYFNDELVITDSGLMWSSGDLTKIYLGNWSSGQTNAMATMSVSNFAVYQGQYIPEPSMFGLLAGTLALGLAGTRRRKRS